MAYFWGKPSDSRRWHLFRGFGLLSLCRKWRVNGADEEEDAKQLKPRPTDCKSCVKEYNAIRAEVYSATLYVEQPREEDEG